MLAGPENGSIHAVAPGVNSAMKNCSPFVCTDDGNVNVNDGVAVNVTVALAVTVMNASGVALELVARRAPNGIDDGGLLVPSPSTVSVALPLLDAGTSMLTGSPPAETVTAAGIAGPTGALVAAGIATGVPPGLIVGILAGGVDPPPLPPQAASKASAVKANAQTAECRCNIAHSSTLSGLLADQKSNRGFDDALGFIGISDLDTHRAGLPRRRVVSARK